MTGLTGHRIFVVGHATNRGLRWPGSDDAAAVVRLERVKTKAVPLIRRSE